MELLDFSSLQFDPPFPVWVVIALAGAATLVALVREIRGGRRLQPRWFHAPALLLRLGVIGLLAFLLMNPVKNVSIEIPESRSIFLVDESASMSLGAADEPSRWQSATAWVNEVRERVVADGIPEPAVMTFSSSLHTSDAETEDPFAERAPEGRETNLAASLERVLALAGAAPPDQIVVVSDGCVHDRHALPNALALAGVREVPLSTRVVGTDTPPRNAWIAAVQSPRMVRPKSAIVVHVDLATTGITPRESLSLVLTDDNGETVAHSDFSLPEGHPLDGGEDAPVEQVLSFPSGLRTGSYTLEFLAHGGEEEVTTDDNRFSFTVEVATSKLRVLFVEGTHVKRTVGTTGHAWNDMELMTRAWDATGDIEYECLTPISEYADSPNLVGVTFKNGEMRADPTRTFPLTREALYKFDVMLISDVPVGNFSNEQMQWVVEWVLERGGGFLMGGGYTTFDVGNYDKTPWERIIPVDMMAYGDGFFQQPYDIDIPESVRSHPIWRISDDPKENEKILATHPRFTGMNRVRRAKPGALVLAVRRNSDNEPVFAAQRYGRGRSMAFLPDPNGGWAKYFVTWGPPGGPPQGPHTELGHGLNFRFKEAAANAARGPEPPHPSPYYAKFWINMARWLGENSIRWQREKLAGRIGSAQAQPGRELPVAAEVLAVTSIEDLIALDVGVRLDIPGSPRARMRYDRDRREFVGTLAVPADVEGGQLTVLFDTKADGASLTDAIPVGLQRANREFSDSAPDRAFLEDLARAGGGKRLESVDQAVSECREASIARARNAVRSWNQPLWPQWPFWVLITALLGLEWLVRRRGVTNVGKVEAEAPVTAGNSVSVAAVLAFVFFVVFGSAEAQELTDTEPVSVEALIEQLGNPRVRLRDEAQEKLGKLPEAMDALQKAAKSAPSEEARLRAVNILRKLKQEKWTIEAVRTGHRTQPAPLVRGLAVSPDGKHFFTRGLDHLRVWDAETFEPGLTMGEEGTAYFDWKRNGPPRTIAVSPDSKRVVTTDDYGSIIIHNVADGSLVKKFGGPAPPAPGEVVTIHAIQTIWTAQFFLDGKRLVTGSLGGGVKVWDTESGTKLREASAPMAIAFSVCLSPDERYVVVAMDSSGMPDYVYVWDLEKGDNGWVWEGETENRADDLQFSADGRQVMSCGRLGVIRIWDFDKGRLSNLRRIGPVGNSSHSVMWSQDGESIFVASAAANIAFSEWNPKTGEEIWRGPPVQRGLKAMRFLGKDRIVTVGNDDRVRIWKRRDAK